ncbi:MAG: ACT domain-containing protein [Clostridiales bacterium]|jgi:hypothetical protein|nr:ACT domain-containing protein [Clostridiales bacterium]
MFISQLSIFVRNSPGSIAEITGILAKAGIDIRAFSVADTTDYGILRLIVNAPDRAEKVLRERGIAVSLNRVIGVQVPDVPGGMHEVFAYLAECGIGIEYGYAFVSRREGFAYAILRVDDKERAAKLLEERNIPMLTPREVYQN